MTSEETTPPVSRRTVLAASIPAVVGLVGMTAVTDPRPANLGDPMGDHQLTDALAPHLGGHRRVAVADLDGSGEASALRRFRGG